MKLKKIFLNSVVVATLIAAPVALSAGGAFAQSAGTVPEDVQTGIDNAQATVEALNPLALAALTVALLPMGAMLTLRFLNMVLSRV